MGTSDRTLVHSERYRGYVVRVHYDEYGDSSPRDWSNLGTIVAWSSRYDLSDKTTDDETPGRMDDPEEFVEWAESNRVFYLPVFIHDHGTVSLSCGGFRDPWDSGQVGYIYVSREKIRKTYSLVDDESAEIFAATLDTVRKVLVEEVEIYGKYVNGEVYGYVVEGPDGEHVDSCWGYVGEDDYCLSEAKAVVDGIVERRAEEDRMAERYMVL